MLVIIFLLYDFLIDYLLDYVFNFNTFTVFGCIHNHPPKGDGDDTFNYGSYRFNKGIVPNLRWGVLPVFCPVNSREAWFKYRLANILLLIYLWYILQRSLGEGKKVSFTPSGAFWCRCVIDKGGTLAPSNKQLITVFNQAMSALGITDQQQIKQLRSELDQWCSNDLFMLASAQMSKRGKYPKKDFRDTHPAHPGSRMEGIYGGWEFVRGVEGGNFNKFVLVHAVAVTANFLGVNPKDVSLVTRGDPYYTDIDRFLPLIYGGYIADVYTATELAALYRMFNRMTFTIDGVKVTYTNDNFIAHMERLSLELGYSKDHLLIIGKDPLVVASVINDFYKVEGVQQALDLHWPNSLCCFYPIKYSVINQLPRVATMEYVGRNPSQGTFKLFPGLTKLSNNQLVKIMDDYLLNDNQVLLEEFGGKSGLELNRWVMYELGIYNMTCPGTRYSGEVVETAKQRYISYHLSCGYYAFNEMRLEVGNNTTSPNRVIYGNTIQYLYFVNSDTTPSIRYYLSLNVFYEDVLGLHGESVTYKSDLMCIIDEDRLAHIVGRENDLLASWVFKAYCNFYSDQQLESYNKCINSGKQLSDSVDGRKEVCVAYLYYEYLLYKRMGLIADQTTNIVEGLVKFNWCEGDEESLYLGYQSMYEITNDPSIADSFKGVDFKEIK